MINFRKLLLIPALFLSLATRCGDITDLIITHGSDQELTSFIERVGLNQAPFTAEEAEQLLLEYHEDTQICRTLVDGINHEAGHEVLTPSNVHWTVRDIINDNSENEID